MFLTRVERYDTETKLIIIILRWGGVGTAALVVRITIVQPSRMKNQSLERTDFTVVRTFFCSDPFHPPLDVKNLIRSRYFSTEVIKSPPTMQATLRSHLFETIYLAITRQDR